MCGIVGVISKYGTLSHYVPSLFTNMLRMDSVRGDDSTGVFGVAQNGLVDYQKGDTDGWRFTLSDAYEKFYKRIEKNYKIVIGHNRAATRGNVTPDNAHPFQERHIILVHNGTLRSTKGLKETEVDSHAIAHALADTDPVQALALLNGAYALVWYDSHDKTLNLARNSERPLFLMEYATMWCISSEPGLPHWLNGREDRKMEKMQLVPTDKIWSFKLDNLSKGYFEIPYEDYREWSKKQEEQERKERAAKAASNFQNSYPSIHTGPNPEPKKTQVAALFRSPSDNVVNLTAGRTQPFKPNDEVIFELDDEKTDDNGANVLLGYPIINGSKDENIVVRIALKANDEPLRYFGLATDKTKNVTAKYFKGRVQQCRNLCGIWTVYTHEFQPYTLLRDAQGSKIEDQQELKEALKEGCSKCQGSVTEEDVPNGIARKKADGKWRIVCPPCLNHAVKEAESRKPHLTSVNAQ